MTSNRCSVGNCKYSSRLNEMKGQGWRPGQGWDGVKIHKNRDYTCYRWPWLAEYSKRKFGVKKITRGLLKGYAANPAATAWHSCTRRNHWGNMLAYVANVAARAALIKLVVRLLYSKQASAPPSGPRASPGGTTRAPTVLPKPTRLDGLRNSISTTPEPG